jgi:hypothetical protein
MIKNKHGKMETSFDSDSSLIAVVMGQYVTRERLFIVLEKLNIKSITVESAVRLFQMHVLKTFHHENPGMNEKAISDALRIVNKDIIKLVEGFSEEK